ncbi:HutD family protein [Cryobacterium frigoriphilum]|uniref:HutD family protein n=1 Tax=Cryobacterium frigoriphilum TaxID=1259150 RepID=A0A4V3IQK7_9MICO|nr:HutD family protein [Cryobacterium frigoriphilum]TFD47195.1 HutD family protein [Cryobacterium frigoriphilum]
MYPTAVRRLAFANVAVTAWRNGGGYTRELATGPDSWPPARATDAFGWRLSIADLTQPALFSPFPGVDRQFLLASAAPLRLDVDGAQHLLQSGEVLAFPGEARVSANPTTGGGRALNLMTRRGRCTGELTIVRLTGAAAWDDPDLVAVVVLGGSVTPRSGRTLGRYDSLHWNAPTRGIRCTAHCSAATVAEVRIRPVTATDI